MAGSESALKPLEHLERTQSGSPVYRFVAELQADVQTDRRVLEDLMGRVRISASRPPAAALAEKLSELKLRLDDRSDGPLRQLEVFEALSLGIEGKRLLLAALRATSGYSPYLNGPDYDGLSIEPRSNAPVSS